MSAKPNTLVISCGAVAREIVTMIDLNGWDHMSVECLPAKMHNDPDRLPGAVRDKITKARDRFDKIVVLYGDCGTGGQMQKVIEEEGVEGIGKAHCYEIFAGSGNFRGMMKDEPGCFFVTDFLARHFEKLVFEGLGLDRFPKLRDTYFGNYRKLVYLAQTEDEDLKARARDAAEKIGLDYEYRFTGYGGFEEFLATQ